MSTGEIIKLLRDEKDWTQDELARVLEKEGSRVNKGMISKWENGIISAMTPPDALIEPFTVVFSLALRTTCVQPGSHKNLS